MIRTLKTCIKWLCHQRFRLPKSFRSRCTWSLPKWLRRSWTAADSRLHHNMRCVYEFSFYAHHRVESRIQFKGQSLLDSRMVRAAWYIEIHLLDSWRIDYGLMEMRGLGKDTHTLACFFVDNAYTCWAIVFCVSYVVNSNVEHVLICVCVCLYWFSFCVSNCDGACSAWLYVLRWFLRVRNLCEPSKTRIFFCLDNFQHRLRVKYASVFYDPMWSTLPLPTNKRPLTNTLTRKWERCCCLTVYV